MATPAENPYGLICDPGPCDPWKVDLFSRDYEPWVLLLFIATAFLAGLRSGRASWGLPLASMGLIAAAIYLQIAGQIKMQHLHYRHLAGPTGNLSADDYYWLGRMRQESFEEAAIGYSFFALAPFLIGLAISFWRQRSKRRALATADPNLAGDTA